jgi:hypothetical protein
MVIIYNMNRKLILAIAFLALCHSASAQFVAVNGIDRDGFGGTYQIDGSGYDNGTYWWMCAEPLQGTGGAGSGQSMIANSLSLAGGWDRQNTQRLSDYSSNPGFYSSAYTRQINILSYVLDTYLRWDLAGTSGRFSEQSSTAANFGSDDAFYNSFFTVQTVLTNLYGSPARTDYTNISTTDPADSQTKFTFFQGNAAGNITALASRESLFNTIVNDIDTKAGTTFFDNYTSLGTYMIISSSYSTANNGIDPNDPNASEKNWQDALVIVAPVPEPSGALLIACTGLAFMLRRFRRVTV